MNFEKFKACVVYACSHGANKLDPIKLNKVLWYSDAAAYMERGESITAARYIRKPRGPVASVMASAIKSLVDSDVLVLGRRFDAELGSWVDEYTVKDDEALAGVLTQDEVGYLQHSVKRVCLDHTSNAISDRTHGAIWQLAADREEIPLFTMYAERLGTITKEHVSEALAA